MKKFMAIMLALVLALGMTSTAFAASITITPPTTDGTESGITYNAYKIFDATISGTNVSYTIENTSPYWSVISQYSNLNATENKTEAEYFTLTKSAGSETTYVVVANSDYTRDVANTFADTLKAVENVTAVGTFTKQANGNYVNDDDDLTDGYYLVTSSVGSDLILDTIGSITVETKNDYPAIDKKVEGKDDYTTADMGEVLPFTIAVNIPEDAVGEIVVHDVMTGLEYTANSMNATIPDGDTDEDEDPDTDTVTGVTAVTTGLETQNPCSVHFTLSAECVAANKGKTVTIAYTAKVTADIANNETWLVDNTFTSKHDDVDVYSTDVVINKVIKGTTTPLENAKFVLKNEAGKFYSVDVNDNVTWVDAQANATEVTTIADGSAKFENIANGTYSLIETVAPAGYNLLTAPVTVSVTTSGTTSKTEGEGEEAVTTTYIAAVTSKVENSAGSSLPSTGGMGTTIFYVVGGMMMAAAFVLLITKRKVASEK